METGGEAKWKSQQNLYRVSGGGCKAGSEPLPGLSFVLGRHKEKGFPLEENFLTEKTVSSLYRERVDSFGNVFVFSLTKNVVKSQK